VGSVPEGEGSALYSRIVSTKVLGAAAGAIVSVICYPIVYILVIYGLQLSCILEVLKSTTFDVWFFPSLKDRQLKSE